MFRIAITGASGLIGTQLTADLRALGHTVFPLLRGGSAPSWNPGTGEISVPEPVDVVLHLAGRSVATRWTARAKREIWDSRIPPTEKLARHLALLPSSQRPRVMISASGIGIYGDRGEEILTEESQLAPAKQSFLADVSREWEAAMKPAEDAGIRVVHPRIGVVLAKHGGAVKKLLLPTKLGLAGPIGKGTQWMSWISLTDLSRLFAFFIEGDMNGAVNAVAPNPVRQHEFMRTLGNALHRPTVFPMPSPVVKLIFGRMGEEVLLGSQRVTSTRMPADFRFQHSTLAEALRAELA